MSKTISKLALAAGVVLAMASTFSCSLPDDEGGDGYDEGSDGYTGSYGSVSYGGQTYRTVQIGSQTWFAENLNYNASGSKCYDNNSGNCTKYGRLYDWETAKEVCPSGWHLPSQADWNVMTAYIGGANTEGMKLKATSGWKEYGNGTNDFGFSALPGGSGDSDDGRFDGVGYFANWWSASESYSGSDYAYLRHMKTGSVAYWDSNVKSLLFSVRCVQD